MNKISSLADPESITNLATLAYIWTQDRNAPEEAKQAAFEAFVWLLVPWLWQHPASSSSKSPVAMMLIKAALEQMQNQPHLRSLSNVAQALLGDKQRAKLLDSDRRWLDRILQRSKDQMQWHKDEGAGDLAQPNWRSHAESLLDKWANMSADELVSLVVGDVRIPRLACSVNSADALLEAFREKLDAISPDRRPLVAYLLCATFGLKHSPSFARVINDVAASVRTYAPAATRRRVIVNLMQDAAAFKSMFENSRRLDTFAAQNNIEDLPYFMDMLIPHLRSIPSSYLIRFDLLRRRDSLNKEQKERLAGYADLVNRTCPSTGQNCSPLLRVASMNDADELIAALDDLDYPELLHENIALLFNKADRNGKLRIFSAVTQGCTSDLVTVYRALTNYTLRSILHVHRWMNKLSPSQRGIVLACACAAPHLNESKLNALAELAFEGLTDLQAMEMAASIYSLFTESCRSKYEYRLTSPRSVGAMLSEASSYFKLYATFNRLARERGYAARVRVPLLEYDYSRSLSGADIVVKKAKRLIELTDNPFVHDPRLMDGIDRNMLQDLNCYPPQGNAVLKALSPKWILWLALASPDHSNSLNRLDESMLDESMLADALGGDESQRIEMMHAMCWHFGHSMDRVLAVGLRALSPNAQMLIRALRGDEQGELSHWALYVLAQREPIRRNHLPMTQVAPPLLKQDLLANIARKGV